jgi:hypothetical protein
MPLVIWDVDEDAAGAADWAERTAGRIAAARAVAIRKRG